MDDLLKHVIDAHGGLDRWSQVRRITAHLTVGGPFWAYKGVPGVPGEETVHLDTARQHITIAPFAGPDRVLTFSTGPEQVTLTAADGTVAGTRPDPRRSFAGYDTAAQWDALQTGYFVSYALWNYLTEPFLLSYPGIGAREIDPWEEDGQRWRRLQVTFPASIATHSTTGIFYFDDDGMQRRMDYEPDVNGSAPVAHYTDEPKTFGGIVVPTRRRIRRRLENGTADTSVDYITIDIHDVQHHS